MNDLPVIQKAYELAQWYISIFNRLPRDQKFALGDRITAGLYDLLEGFDAHECKQLNLLDDARLILKVLRA